VTLKRYVDSRPQIELENGDTHRKEEGLVFHSGVNYHNDLVGGVIRGGIDEVGIYGWHRWMRCRGAAMLQESDERFDDE
jgi:hypothetical protein